MVCLCEDPLKVSLLISRANADVRVRHVWCIKDSMVSMNRWLNPVLPLQMRQFKLSVKCEGRAKPGGGGPVEMFLEVSSAAIISSEEGDK